MHPPLAVYDEEDWNKESSLSRNPYYYSKRLAEEKAYAWHFRVVSLSRNEIEISLSFARWEMYQQQKGTSKEFDLVVINPSVVLGPDIKPYSVNTRFA